MSGPASQPASPAGLAGWALLSSLMLLSALVYTAALALGWGGKELQVVLGNTLNQLPAILASLLATLTARRHRGGERLAWGFVAAALWSYTVADVVWAYFELIAKTDPFPSLADVFYIGFPLLMFAGLMLMPKSPLSPLERWKIGLDVAVVVGAAAVFCWQAFLAATVVAYGGDRLGLAVSLFYPVADLALLALLLLMAMRQGSIEVHQLLLGVGVCLFVFGDTWFNVVSATESYVTGTPMDSLWIWALVAIALAALSSLHRFQQGWVRSGQQVIRRLSGAGVFMPYVAVMFTFYLVVAHRSTEGLVEAGVLLGAALVTLLVIARQMLAFAENRQLTLALQGLNHDLERRVEERTRELEENRERLLATEKLAALGRLTAGIAHEINTPLAASMNHLRKVRRLGEEYRESIGQSQVGEADHREIAADLLKATEQANASLERMGEFIRRMRAQGRNPEEATASFDPLRVARETLALLESQALEAGVRLELSASPGLSALYGESGRFSQVLSNLVQNAIHACEDRRAPDGPAVTVALLACEGGLLLEVRDNGGGIPAAVQPKIFEPLFTTKPVGKGTGLGLPIIRDIVRGHFGGEVEFQTQEGQGTTFAVRLPLRGAAQAEGQPPAEGLRA